MKKALLIAAAIIAISTQASAFETKDIPKHCDDVAESIMWKYYGNFPKEDLDSDPFEYLMAEPYINYATFTKFKEIPKEVAWVEDKKSWLVFICNKDGTGKVIFVPQSKYKLYTKDVDDNLFIKDTKAIEKSILE